VAYNNIFNNDYNLSPDWLDCGDPDTILDFPGLLRPLRLMFLLRQLEFYMWALGDKWNQCKIAAECAKPKPCD
jgi:hypothetical protein